MTITRWGRKREALERAEGYLRECCEHLSLTPKELSKSAKKWIVTRRWDDFDNSLRRAVYSAALACSHIEITAGHFAPCVRRDHPEFLKVQVHELAIDDIVREKMSQFFTKVGRHEVEGVYKAVMDNVERPLVEQALAHVKGNQLKAARILGINRNTLFRKMRSFKITGRGPNGS
jgi:Fis family transcriptional regulator